MIYPSSSGARGRSGRSRSKSQPVVQWKQRNVQEGLVVVDEQQLSRLIKRDPIEKYYELDAEPFATGMFSNVRRCRSRDTGQHFAAKFSSRARYGEDCSPEIHHEIALLSLCSPSPRIIRLHDVFETELEIIIVLEYAPGGDLQTIIDDNLVPFESDVVKFVRQLVEGLAYLHERKIAHLDIKPQNLVMMADFPDCDVKLCDFEISRVVLEGTEIREILGTPDYVAPEILHYEPITLAADMWSLGVTTYVLLTGFSPFGGESDQETFCNISRAQLDFPEELFEDVSEDARDFIRHLLVRDPSARPTAKECLRHRWFSNRAPMAGKAAPQLATRSESLRESSSVGSKKNLRKYLSKSREALFERVVQQQQNQKNSSLRKTTLLNQYHKTRLCESQVSLVSKSREGLLMGENQLMMSPSFSRSREKLYGLRSLSRSHEVLDLCKGIGGVVSGTPGILRSLTRATTADLSMLPFWRQQILLANAGISTTSIPSSLNAGIESPHSNSVEDVNTIKHLATATQAENSMKIPVISDADETQSIPSPLAEDEISSLSLNEAKTASVVSVASSPSVDKSVDVLNANGVCKSPSLDTTSNTFHVGHYEEKILENDNTCEINDSSRISAASNSSRNVVPSPQDIEKSDENHCREHPDKEITPGSVIRNDSEHEAEELMPTSLSSVQENDSTDNKPVDEEDSEDQEPRYTVRQLVSAFNRHEEVVTKSSLEVAMTTNEKYFDRSLFPTGPNALRLFIPDIDISAEETPKFKRKHRRESPSEENVGSQCDVPPKEIGKNARNTNDKIKSDGNNEECSDDLYSSSDSFVQQKVTTLVNLTDGVENVDSTNNNDVEKSMISVCHLVIEPPECRAEETEVKGRQGNQSTTSNLHLSVNVGPQYIRSGSISSDASLTPGTPSETAMSWEELTGFSGNKQLQKPRPSSSASDPVACGFVNNSSSSWGRVCTGSYTRAMEKFSGKTSGESERKSNRMSLTLPSSPQLTSNEKTRRKSSPAIKPFN
ncbi:uncharacterized protein [Anabrus simplex]|uniref:uncharacterized protein n=1 Tax=Anabrus simplex TaxID=316456 RepID=UPI0035A3298A